MPLLLAMISGVFNAYIGLNKALYRLDIYERVLADFIEYKKNNPCYPVYVCPRIVLATKLSPYFIPLFDQALFIQKDFPEFYAQKPDGVYGIQPWWEPKDLDSRIQALRNAIKMVSDYDPKQF